MSALYTLYNNANQTGILQTEDIEEAFQLVRNAHEKTFLNYIPDQLTWLTLYVKWADGHYEFIAWGEDLVGLALDHDYSQPV